MRHLMDVLGLSQHRACLIVGVARSAFQRAHKHAKDVVTFDVHTHALLEQETANESMLDNLYHGNAPIMSLGLMGTIPTRDLNPVQNLAYVTPPGVAEATMPLQALIAMFSTEDAAPLAAAEQWKAAGDQLEHTLHQLHQVSTTIAARTTDLSFDAARTAINDITTLQPSLDTLTPPVTNLTIPTTGHTGGGNLHVHTGGPTNTRLDIHHITGTPPATPTPGSAPRGHTTTPRNGGGVGGQMASGTGTVRLPHCPTPPH